MTPDAAMLIAINKDDLADLVAGKGVSLDPFKSVLPVLANCVLIVDAGQGVEELADKGVEAIACAPVRGGYLQIPKTDWSPECGYERKVLEMGVESFLKAEKDAREADVVTAEIAATLFRNLDLQRARERLNAIAPSYWLVRLFDYLADTKQVENALDHVFEKATKEHREKHRAAQGA